MHNSYVRGKAAHHCIDYKRCKQLIKRLVDTSAPPLLRSRTIDAAGAIVAIFWATLEEDLNRVDGYHRLLLQELASRFHALQISVRASDLISNTNEVAELLRDYRFSISFAVANVRAIEKLAKKLAKVVKFPVKDAIFLHALQTQPFARAVVPAAIAEHLNVLLLMAQDASPRPLKLQSPFEDAFTHATASTIACGGCSCSMQNEHKVLACGHTRCLSCFMRCRKLGMNKLASQRNNIALGNQRSPLRWNDFSVITCDACSHTFVATAEECQPTHAASAFLGSRCATKLHGKMSAVSASSLGASGAVDGSLDLEDDAEEDVGDLVEESSHGAHISRCVKQEKQNSLSEAAFYMSLGESDGADGASATFASKGEAAAALARIDDVDDGFDGVDGKTRPLQKIFAALSTVSLRGRNASAGSASATSQVCIA